MLYFLHIYKEPHTAPHLPWSQAVFLKVGIVVTTQQPHTLMDKDGIILVTSLQRGVFLEQVSSQVRVMTFLHDNKESKMKKSASLYGDYFLENNSM